MVCEGLSKKSIIHFEFSDQEKALFAEKFASQAKDKAKKKKEKEKEKAAKSSVGSSSKGKGKRTNTAPTMV